MTPSFIDTHCHLHSGAYDEDRNAVLLRMKQKNAWAITVGTNGATSHDAIALADREPSVFATVGYHPGNLTSSHEDPDEKRGQTSYSKEHMATIARSSERIVAIGEIGLDYHHIDPELDQEDARERQKSAFREQIALANELNLPVVIHCRDAMDDVIEILKETRVRAVMHCFTGNGKMASRLLDLGCFLSFTGNITFKPRASDDPEEHVHRVIERMPLDRCMIETDAPWLAPVPYRGKRNEPIYAEFVAEKIAELRGEPVQTILEQTTKNAMSFFRLDQ